MKIREVAPKTTGDKVPGSVRKAAIYCWLSAQEENQALSYEQQVKTCMDLINSNVRYQLYDIYADLEITDTYTMHMYGFQQMIEDCRAGKINLILTKSIYRFAGNEMDTLKSIQMLSNLPHPVEVIFETEHVDTFDPDIYSLLMKIPRMAGESRPKNEQ